MNNLIATGFVYDIVGVCVLVVALMAIRRRELFLQAGTYSNGNKALFRALVLQHTDARFGFSILVAGFVLQLVGAVGLDVPPGRLWVILIPLVLVLIAYAIVRRRVSKGSDRMYDELRAKQEAESGG